MTLTLLSFVVWLQSSPIVKYVVDVYKKREKEKNLRLSMGIKTTTIVNKDK